MKKLILAAFALTTAASVFAQGTVVFNMKTSAGTAHIWGPASGAASTLSLIGTGSNDSASGTTAFAASGMALIGAGNQAGGAYGYGTTFAQLLSGPTGATEASMLPSTPTTTFKSGASLGLVSAVTATLANVAGDTAAASLEMVAWDNSSNLYSTWTAASAAWKLGLIAAGESGIFPVTAVGGSVNTPANIAVTGASFNLYFIPVPEPSTFALAGLGLAALVAFRRRS